MIYGRHILKTFAAMVLVCSTAAFAENIDPYNDDSQFAYGENIGWVNFEPNLPDTNVGVTVTDNDLTGFIWAENIGWISLSPAVYGGVINDGAGNLSGYAWSENVGWINFGPNYGGVTIDSAGNFDGWAWGENIGWIHFKSESPVSYGVMVCVVNLEDLANFAADWLQSGSGLDADLDSSNDVDFLDYSIFADYWQTYCPTGWLLKPQHPIE